MRIDQGPLTPREREVIRLVATGLQNKQIEALLSVSESTVRLHVGSALTKTGSRNRVELTLWALGHGLATVPAPAPQERWKGY